MAFEKKVPEWSAAGIEPPESLKESGFTPGYKPPAEYFNWFMHGMSEAATELQTRVDDSAPAPFVVTLSGNKDDGYTIDSTFDAIVGAYNQGRVIRLIEFVPGPAIMEYKLEVAVSDQVVFANSERMYHKTVNIYRNGRITRVDQTLYSDKYPPHYSDMGAEPVGAVSDHNESADAHAGLFVPSTGGTIDGNITATSDTTTRFFSCDVGSYDVRLLANTAGNRGIYDSKTGTWLLLKDLNNKVTLNGFASAFGSDAIKQVSTSVTTSQIAKGGYLSQQTTKATAVDGYEPFAVFSVQSNSSYVLPYYYFLSNVSNRTIGYSIRNLNTSEAITPQLTFHVLYRKTTV